MPALAKKVDLVVGVDAAFEVESQMEVKRVAGGQRRVTARFSAKAFSQAAFGLRLVVRQTVAFWRCTSRSSTLWAAA